MMSGIVAIVARDDRRVELAEIGRSVQALAHRGWHGCDQLHLGWLALGHQHAWTTPEEVGERQPLVDHQAGLAMVWDGRLDNRGELIEALNLGRAGHGRSDAALALAAFERWDTACFARFLGAFAAVVADLRGHRVVCGRDQIGSRTLCYHLSASRLVVASEPFAVAAHPGVPDGLDEDTAALWHAGEIPSDGATFFSAVRELGPAHQLTVHPRHSQLERYWQPDSEPSLHYRNDTEYAEHFAAVLGASVVARLRAPEVPAVLMSGGLDSTSVAALAAREMARRQPGTGLPGTRLRTFSWIFETLPDCDERATILPVVEAFQLDATYCRADDAWPLSHFEDPIDWPTNPSAPEGNAYRRLKQRMYQAAAQAGVTVLLTGVGGDELHFGLEDWLADLVADRRWGDAAREVGRHVRHQGLRRVLRSQSVRRLAARWWPGIDLGGGEQAPAWLTDFGTTAWSRHYAQNTNAQQTGAQPGKPSAKHPEKRPKNRPEQRDVALGAYATQSAGGETYYAAQHGLELRHPFRDRRVVSFLLSVPAHQLYNRGVLKPLVRAAMKGVLPEVTRECVRCGTLTPFFDMGMRREATRIRAVLGAERPVWHRYVKERWMWEQVERLEGRPAPARSPEDPDDSAVWFCVSHAAWLQRRRTFAEFQEVPHHGQGLNLDLGEVA